MKGNRILVVEDDPVAAEYLALVLGEEGCEVRAARNGVEALLALESELPRLVISDLRMPEMDGLALLLRVKQRWPDLPFILLTVEQDVSTIVEAMRLGAANYLVKPVSPQALLSAVKKALTPAPAPRRDHPELPEIVGRSKAIVEVRHRVVLAARSDVNVLITGETGTGKELVARAIHRLSKLAKSPFVAQNCAAIPQALFESQFFGHRRGSFTGADRDHRGLLEKAHGGFLFLDELESLSLLHQGKLLRVMDDGLICPVGSVRERRVSIRFLASTNCKPAGMIREGLLREDLYYRLRGFEIYLPPLRERKEDIPLLAAHFLGGAAELLTKEARDVLGQLPWRGNVRELQNVLHSAEAVANGGPITLEHLEALAPASGEPVAADGPASPPAAGGMLRCAEREAILRALLDCGGNRSRAARKLGIDRSTLRRKMARLSIGERTCAPAPQRGRTKVP